MEADGQWVPNFGEKPTSRLGDTPYGSLKKARAQFAEEDMKKRLEPVDGVAAVKIAGGLEDEIQVAIDNDRLAQLGL